MPGLRALRSQDDLVLLPLPLEADLEPEKAGYAKGLYNNVRIAGRGLEVPAERTLAFVDAGKDLEERPVRENCWARRQAAAVSPPLLKSYIT